jgi:hypothetical protein
MGGLLTRLLLEWKFTKKPAPAWFERISNASELDDPNFWKKFFESIPAGSDREYEMLADVAANAGVAGHLESGGAESHRVKPGKVNGAIAWHGHADGA